MPTSVYVQKVISLVEMGAIACTMLPQRVAIKLERFTKTHVSGNVQTHVYVSEACHHTQEQEVFAVVANMTSYLGFSIPENDISVPVAVSTGDTS
jgi:hypothetical protein